MVSGDLQSKDVFSPLFNQNIYQEKSPSTGINI